MQLTGHDETVDAIGAALLERKSADAEVFVIADRSIVLAHRGVAIQGAGRTLHFRLLQYRKGNDRDLSRRKLDLIVQRPANGRNRGRTSGPGHDDGGIDLSARLPGTPLRADRHEENRRSAEEPDRCSEGRQGCEPCTNHENGGAKRHAPASSFSVARTA